MYVVAKAICFYSILDNLIWLEDIFRYLVVCLLFLCDFFENKVAILSGSL